MKSLADALAQREQIFGAFEMAGLEADEQARQAWLTFVVVGGGPTGVEISGQRVMCLCTHAAFLTGFKNRFKTLITRVASTIELFLAARRRSSPVV